MERIIIDDVELVLTKPVEQELEWIGQTELVEQILASWLVVGEKDLPLCPRLIGKPGVGKTTLAYYAARAAGLPAYIHQCTVDTRPEDLLVSPVLSREGKISYHASPLVTAMVKGGVAILDEANRMSEKSWASLAPLLDHRRYVESIVAGIRIPAHASFRACITMNDDASTYEIPDYMLSRLQPTVEVDFPEREEEFRILRYHLPFAPDEVLQMTVDFLEEGHKLGLGHSTRDGINIVRYALKRKERARRSSRAKEHRDEDLRKLFERAVEQVLGKDALDLKKHALRKDMPKYLDLREFFSAVEGPSGEREDAGEADEDETWEDPDGGRRRPPGPRKGRPKK